MVEAPKNSSNTGKTTESTLQTPDGHRLYTKTFHAESPPGAHVIFLHGFSDHCNFYSPLFEILSSPPHNIAVHTFDQRGWGRSVQRPSQRGLTGSTEQVMADIGVFVGEVLKEVAGTEGRGGVGEAGQAAVVPVFLMGHSMGGAQALYFAATGPPQMVNRIRGVLAEAPFIGFHPRFRPSGVEVAVAKLAARIVPNLQRKVELDVAGISRDEEVRRRWEEDEFNFGMGTLAGLKGMLERAESLESGKVKVGEERGEGGKTRMWVSHGTEDTIAGLDCVRKFWSHHDHVRDKELKVYEGWRHKLHMEPGEDKREYARDVAKWILDRSGPSDENVKAKL